MAKAKKAWSPHDHGEINVGGQRYFRHSLVSSKREAEVIARKLRKSPSKATVGGFLARVKGATGTGYGVYKRHKV